MNREDKEKLLLKPKEMLQPIWEMGVELEKQGKEPTQVDRFNVIAQAQLDKILYQPWLDKPSEPGDYWKAKLTDRGDWKIIHETYFVVDLEQMETKSWIRWQKAIVPEPPKES